MQKNRRANDVKLILGVIGFDSHVIGNRILEYALGKEGFNVINLGIFASQGDFINAAIEADADAILVGSLYGHAELDCENFKNRCIEAGLNDILLYIGGNLAVGGEDWQYIETRFKEIGFDKVFPPETLPKDVISSLKEDLRLD